MKMINLGLGQKVWKAFKEKSRIIVHLHVAVVRTLRKTLITTWRRCCAKFILDKTSFRIPVLWKHWHFELHVWSIRVQCWPDSESGGETILASDSSSEFARSENCWPWLSLILSSSDKNRVVLCSCEGFGMKPVFLRPFTNALIVYLPGQRSWETICCAAVCEGNDQWGL